MLRTRSPVSVKWLKKHNIFHATAARTVALYRLT